MAIPLRALAGCSIERHCRCSTVFEPIRLLLTDGPHRADMPLRRTVKAMARCEQCGDDRHLALVSDPNWRKHQPAGRPPEWSVTLTGPEAVMVALTHERG